MDKGLMTEGNVYRRILYFSIPLILGNFFQLMYNTIDSIVVGNYVGTNALAAVGASTPIINLLIAFFAGLATGAGVVVAQLYGARRVEEESRAIHTFELFALIFGILLSIAGLLLSGSILKWIGTPDNVIGEAKTYLSIYFTGTVFVVLYNSSAGILQALGDSKHPLYFLIMTSVLNIILDVVFVRFVNMGVGGAALATIVSQALATVLVMRLLMTTDAEWKLDIRKLGVDWNILKRIVQIGIPSGIQGMIVSFSNLFVMGYINGYGSAAIAGFSAANKIDNFMGLPLNSISLATTTFCGQNIGAGKFDRVKQGVRAALVMSCGIVIVLGIIVFTNAEAGISLFSSDADVLAAGSKLLRIMCPFYIFLCFHQVYSGALRGGGRTTYPMLSSVFSFVVVRQIFLALTSGGNDFGVIGWCYSGTWMLACVLTAGFYFGSHWLQEEMKSKTLKG